MGSTHNSSNSYVKFFGYHRLKAEVLIHPPGVHCSLPVMVPGD
jgi:hypothetical protein